MHVYIELSSKFRITVCYNHLKKYLQPFGQKSYVVYDPKSNFNFLSNLDLFFLYICFGRHKHLR